MVVKHNLIDLRNNILENKTHANYTFVQALNDKYVDQEELDNQFVLPKSGLISTDITFVGFGKVSSVQKQLKRLTSIDLSCRGIRTAGNLSELNDSLFKVQILNLADNHLIWEDIIQLTSHLPNLKEIVLTGNQLSDFSNVPKKPARKISVLTLGRINLKWAQFIDVLSRIWSNIDQLDLWNNDLSEEDMLFENCNNSESNQLIRNLTTLKLSHNNLTSFDWISKLGPIENLRELDLSHCHLQTINLDTKALKCLENLKVLNISHNDIEDWLSISNLNSIRALTTLMCNDNPFYIREKFAKFLTIARLRNLIALNREEITNSMRRDSEILYLRRSGSEFTSFKDGKNDKFIILHPRFEELVQIYGLPDDPNAKSANDKYITVNLILDDKQIVKKVPCDMRVSNLQMLCKRLFKLRPSSNIRITCMDMNPSENNLSYELDKGGQTLHFFSLKNNCQLQIKVEP